jgi:peptidyl-prolyl cis-trans isomerase B (cyclophilin B)
MTFRSRHVLHVLACGFALGLPWACDRTPNAASTDQSIPPQHGNEKHVTETHDTPQTNDTDLPVILLETSLGTLTVELAADKAPETTANFLRYVDEGLYEGTIFHRVIPGFMIQGGGFTPQMEQRPTGQPIQNEAANGLRNKRGTLAMARTSDPHSATSQFFINHKNNDFLDHREPTPDGFGYCVFGRVIDGMEVVDRIAEVQTQSVGVHDDVPVEPVLIEKATRP